ncbi:TIGR00341 family protein [Pseudomonadota bacterium]
MRMIDVISPPGSVETVQSLADSHGLDHWVDAQSEDGRTTVHILVGAQSSQKMLDRLQAVLANAENARIIISNVEATLPVIEDDADPGKGKTRGIASSREELLSELNKNSQLNLNFFILVFLSAVVAAVGLIKDNVAVVVGAMVIAPLLGPNLSLALGTALGDRKLMWRSVKTNVIGLALTLALAMLVGLLWPVNLHSQELMSRTDLGLDSVALALASGAAAVLSLTTGLSSVLVGVMVAVALMPPAVTAGLMLSSGQFSLFFGALLLMVVNIVCLNFAANLVFFAKGVGPRTWHEKNQARRSMIISISFWAALLAILMVLIVTR